MKYLIKFYTALIFLLFFSFNSFATEKIKIGLVIPLSGENKELGQTILKSVKLAINDINDNRIVIVPKDNQNDPNKTLEVSKELYKEGIKIIIGPIFKKNTFKLNQLSDDLLFLSFTNKIDESQKNILSAGVNSVSQFNAIKKFQSLNKIERSFLLAPNTSAIEEIKTGVKKSRIKLKDEFYYDPDPTLITKQIEEITRYRIRKQNLEDEVKRVENSNEANKEKKLAQLEKLTSANIKRRTLTDRYIANLKGSTITLPFTTISETDKSVYHIMPILLPEGFDRISVINHLKKIVNKIQI